MISAIQKDTDVFVITWVLNNICNRACHYCPDSLHNGKNHHYDWKYAEAFADLMIQRHKDIHVVVTGGEPTMSPWLPDLIKKFNDNGHTIGLTSNGGRTLRYYEAIAPMLYYICLSWHPDPEDPDFLEKALATHNHCFTKINLMMPADQWDRAMAMHDIIKKTNLIWEPVRITQWHDHPRGIASRNYTQEQLKWFEQNKDVYPTREKTLKYIQQRTRPTPLMSTVFYEDGSTTRLEPINLINNNQNSFKGWECDQGVESLFLQYTGEIGLSNCPQNRNIGNITQLDDVRWPSGSQICEMDRCPCATDIFLSKRKLNSLDYPMKNVVHLKDLSKDLNE